MDCLNIKEYDDFKNIVKSLNENKSVKVNLKELKNNIKIRIIDLITGYIYDKGKIKKESLDTYIISLER